MKALIFDGEQAEYREDVPVPKPDKGQSLVKVLAAAVCNTDKEILKGYRPDFKGIMGHEFIGIVTESSQKELIGKRVAGEINGTCGECIYCKTGRKSHCSSRRVLGMSVDGCFAEYLAIDTNLLHQIPDELPTELAIYTEPLAAACEILTQIQITEQQNIGIIGDGRLAYCVAQVMHAVGYGVTVVGRHDEKLALLKDVAEVTKQWQPEQFEIVIEATGSPSGMRQALEMVRKKGTIVLKSTFSQENTLPMSMVAVNEITIVGSRCGPFPEAIALLADKKIDMPPVKWYELADWEEAFSSTAFKNGFRIG